MSNDDVKTQVARIYEQAVAHPINNLPTVAERWPALWALFQADGYSLLFVALVRLTTPLRMDNQGKMVPEMTWCLSRAYLVAAGVDELKNPDADLKRAKAWRAESQNDELAKAVWRHCEPVVQP
jgi:hypothetical protein